MLLAATSGAWEPLATQGFSEQGRLSDRGSSDYEIYTLDTAQLTAAISAAPIEFSGLASVPVEIPKPDGTIERFDIVESPVMAPELAAKYPQLKTYRGQGIDRPASTLRLDVTPAGFHAQVLSSLGSYYVDPANLDQRIYASYASLTQPSLEPRPSAARSATHSSLLPPHKPPLSAASRGESVVDGGRVLARSSGTELRVIRTAIAAVGEYTAFHGGTVAGGLGAVVTTVNRINGIYEREVGVRLELVANNDLLIYTNGATDPYTNGEPFTLLTQNQINTDSVIGTGNYDLGHVFGTAGGGLAQLSSAGISTPPLKAQGMSGISQPTGDRFWVDFVAHELGHQFGAFHTWNGDSSACTAVDHSPDSAYEPGSGSTIMSYAGICGNDNLQFTADPVFHSGSFEEIVEHLEDVIPVVGTRAPTGNRVPSVDGGRDYTIPALTPFALTAVGADADSADILTYSWEQHDLGPRVDVNAADNGASPLFRAWPPTADPTRVFPRLEDLLNNTTSVGETLPTLPREMNFRVTVRDNQTGGGGVNSDDVVLNVIDTGAPFQLTSHTGPQTVPARSVQTVTWNVAGTDANGINTAYVNILLSTDGGLTFPHELAIRTANDGLEQIVMPSTLTNQARIKVKAVDNIFFDVSDANFTLSEAAAGIVALTSGGSTDLSEGGTGDHYTVMLNTVPLGEVIVRVTPSDGIEVSADGVNFTRSLDLRFTDSEPQTVFARAPENDEFAGVELGTIQHTVVDTADFVSYPTTTKVNELTVNLLDNDLAPFARVGPEGGFMAVSENTSFLGNDGAAHEFTVFIEAGQTASAVVEPTSREVITVELDGVSAAYSSSAPGLPAVLPPTPVTVSGVYTIRISSTDRTSFTLAQFSNAALELDTSGGEAPDITSSFVELGSGRFGVLGSFNEIPTESSLAFAQRNDPGAFVDISSTGSALNLRYGEETPIFSSVGNSVFPAGTVSVANNGVVFAGDLFDVPLMNQALPSSSFEAALVPYWDDLSAGTGNVFWEERQIDGVDALIVQWHDRPHFVSGGSVTFQVQLLESGPVLARYAYQDAQFGNPAVDFGASATIGYQADRSSATRFSMDAATLADGDVLELGLPALNDTDDYLIDWSGQAGTAVDIVLAGIGADLSQATLELVGVDGSTVLARGLPNPLQSSTGATNYDLAILNFEVPADGVYTIRTISEVEGDYGMVVTDSLVFDTEPNDAIGAEPLRRLPLGGGALGFLDVSVDAQDLYELHLEAGTSLLFMTETPQGPVLNQLDPEIAVLHPDGSTLLEADQDSASDGSNAQVIFTAPVTGDYTVRVAATSGFGEYLLSTTTADEQPDVELALDRSTILETDGSATLSAELSFPAVLPVTVSLDVSGTATPAEDYTLSESEITIAPGSTMGSIDISAVSDSVHEGDETIVIEISAISNAGADGAQQVSLSIVDDDPAGFLVSSLVATPSGFTAHFNGLLDGDILNLYDTASAGLGDADVSLVGAVSGPVRGSLLVGESSVRFIKSGGPLAPDTYTVRLRSAESGFQDRSAALLDGDGDGTAGDDYVSSFTMDLPPGDARTIQLPDFVRGPGQQVNVPADSTVGIPISISDGDGVRAIDMRISYDPALLEIHDAVAPAGGTVILNNLAPGLAILVFFSSTPLPPGETAFINLQADIPTDSAGEVYGTSQILDVHGVIVGDGSDNEFPVVVDDSLHLTSYFADVSGNGRVNASDAAQVARLAALVDSGFAVSLNTDPVIVGDISGNGRVNASDASQVAQFAALLPVANIPPIPLGVSLSSRVLVGDPTMVLRQPSVADLKRAHRVIPRWQDAQVEAAPPRPVAVDDTSIDVRLEPRSVDSLFCDELTLNELCSV